MKEVISILLGFLFLIYVGSQVGCLLEDIFEEENKNGEGEEES